jgi:hypothetical protein
MKITNEIQKKLALVTDIDRQVHIKDNPIGKMPKTLYDEVTELDTVEDNETDEKYEVANKDKGYIMLIGKGGKQLSLTKKDFNQKFHYSLDNLNQKNINRMNKRILEIQSKLASIDLSENTIYNEIKEIVQSHLSQYRQVDLQSEIDFLSTELTTLMIRWIEIARSY